MVNVRKVKFSELCATSETGTFNHWQESVMVTCDEIRTEKNNKYKIYEGLKDLFELKT